MPIPITIPRLGWSMEQGTFGGWLKPDGAAVQVGDALFTLESDKAAEEVEALDAGILRILPDGPRPGDTVPVGQEIACLLSPEEAARPKPESAAPQAAAAPASPSVRRLARAHQVNLIGVNGTGPHGRITAADVQRSLVQPVQPVPAAAADRVEPTRAPALPAISPRARRAAAELGVDWTRLRGSGKTGRIRECDVRAAVGPSDQTVDRDVNRIRQQIARHLVHSVQTTAPVTLTTTADATHLVQLREQFRAVAGNEPIPSYTDFLVKLAAIALRQHPHLNARWEDEAVVLESAIHVGIAVDTDAGLLVPVVRAVPELSVRQLAARTRDLIGRARQRQLRADEMQGGTFTVTNLGSLGIDAFTPIIHAPQCAILGIGRIECQPVVYQGQITARERLTLSLTFDHRIVDGAPAARLLQTLAALLENPAPALLT